MSLYAPGMEDEYVIVNPGYGKPKFSRTEIRDIVVSVVVLAVAFMILYRNNQFASYLDDRFGETAKWVVLLVVCIVLVTFSFLLHEFGHKFTAQRYGLWSEFRMYPMGLVLTLVTSVIGFLFAAPGAVMISGNMDDRKNGKISIAGPAVNIVLAGIGIAVIAAIGMVSQTDPIPYDGVLLPLFYVAGMLASLNSFLALFNLIPIPPLDGSKVFRWNAVVWVVAIAVAALELVYLYLWSPSVLVSLV